MSVELAATEATPTTVSTPTAHPVMISHASENIWQTDNSSPSKLDLLNNQTAITHPNLHTSIAQNSTSFTDSASRVARMPYDHQTTNKQPPLSILLLNETFCARVAILFIIFFLWFVTILYAIGQILSLHLTNYWCPQMTLQDVRQNSIEQEAPEGITNSCWRSDSIFTVDQDALWSNESYSFELEITLRTMMQLLSFGVLSACFFGSIFYITKCTYDDIKRYRHNILGRTEYLKLAHFKQNQALSTLKYNKLSECIARINRIYKKYFKVDSGRWCLLMIIREIIEILVQSLALLLYNGTFLFANPFDDETDIRLANRPQYVKIFTVFLSANCMIAGILWIFYALKPYLCHGVLFYLIISCFDALFDIFYTIFPLIIVFSNKESTILTTLAALQTNSATAFWVTFLPLLFLLFKFLGLSNKIIGSLRKHYANIYEQKLKNGDQNTDIDKTKLHAITPHLTTNSVMSWVIRDFDGKSNETEENSAEKSKTDINMVEELQSYVENLRYKHSRKCSIILVASLFIIYAFTIMVIVFQHFDHAASFCTQLTDQQNNFLQLLNDNSNNITEYEFDRDIEDLLHDNSELFLFEFCEYKVYPFNIDGKSDICQCRNFRFHQEEFAWNSIELEEYFGVDLVEIGMNAFKKWYMLEKVEFKDVESVYRPETPHSFNFTSDMFYAKELKAIRFEKSPIIGFDDKISNWESLVHFEMVRSGSFKLPSTLSKLVKLESFIDETNFEMETLPAALCELPRLRVIDASFSLINTVPFCFASSNLESINIESTAVRNIPLGLFNMNSLKRLQLALSAFTVDDLIKYNNLSSETEFNDQFTWNENTWFHLDGSEICLSHDNNSVVQQFLNFTDSCQGSCDGTLLQEAQCLSLWQNGVCDAGCNTVNCHWDGGDCLQLCECLKDEDDYKMLGDGHCDKECNTTNCNYDQYDCIDTTNNAICNQTYDLGQHDCNPEWINDNWCDGNCEYNSLCDYDGKDCDQHSCDPNAGKQCEYAFDTFSIIANGQSSSNDNHISIDEWCGFWPIIVGILSVDYYNPADNTTIDFAYFNCTAAFDVSDLDQNGQLNFRELLIISFVVQDITLEKAEQLNCSRCTGVDDYYN